MWHIYIIKCSDKTLYTGITTDVERRLDEHNSSTGAKYTRGRGPVELLYTAEFEDKPAASKEEYRIKQMTRADKLKFIENKKENPPL